MMPTYIYVIISFFIAACSVYALIPVACRIGLVDHPDSRKQHKKKTPLIGGVAVMFAISCTAMLMHIDLHPFRSLFLGSALLLFVGVLDDMHEVSPSFRLIFQFMAALFLIYPGGFHLSYFGHLFGESHNLTVMPFVGCLLTIIAVMAMINAMNMLDGQDGLLGGISCIQMIWFAIIAHMFHLHDIYHLLLVIIGALLGFLVFNFRLPGRLQGLIFMGDAGSTVMGYMAAWFAIFLSQSHSITMHVRPVAFLWVLALPLFDVSAAFCRRLIHRQSPFKPDRGHLHHIIQYFGIKVSISSLFLYVFSAILGAVGVLGEWHGISEAHLFFFFLGLWVVYTCCITLSNSRLNLGQIATSSS